MRVLVVEDERLLADAIAAGLRAEGMAVDVAYDGASALDKARLNGYDVVRDVDGHALAAQPAGDRVRDPAFVLGDEHPHLNESNGSSRPRTPVDSWPDAFAVVISR
jgi:hypothetical protein